jgi:uncharacterized protein YprB with RNaseH-like and TPR domain
MNSSSEEWLSNLIPYLKKVLLTPLPPQTILNYKKTNSQNEDQFDLLAVTHINETATTISSITHLENTTHSYQIIQGDLGIKLLLKNLLKQESVCFDTETTGLDACMPN